MEKTKIIRFGREVELFKYVPDLYLISERANPILDQLREGISTWVSPDRFIGMNLSVWIYEDTNVNAFCSFQNDCNYIALSIGLLSVFWDTVNDFMEKEKFNIVFKVSEANRPIVMELLYFYMLNFTIAHEFGHIAHGHLRESSCNNYIDEIFCLSEGEKTKNWSTQLKEYDADSLAVMIQAFLFIQQWEDDIYANLSRFDNMFIANYLCFRTFADKTGRSFRDYMEKEIDEYDHPHPGIRMYYAYILYSYWIGTWKGYTTDVIRVLTSGSHAVVSYEKQILEKNSISECYYSVAYTEKGSQHVMNLNNGWEELIDYFNQYAYVPIERLGNIDSLPFSVNENGDFILKLNKGQR